MTIKLRAETIKRLMDETECDCCGARLTTGAPCLVDLTRGTVYCSRQCAEDDAPIIPMPPPYLRAA